MSKPTDSNPTQPANSFAEFTVPDKSELGWVPAEHVVVDVASTDLIGAFVPGEPAFDPAPVEFEFEAEITGLNIEDLITQTSETDLNELLESLSTSQGASASESQALPKSANNILASLDDAAVDPQTSDTEANLPFLTDIGLGGLTVIVDDDGADTVAI